MVTYKTHVYIMVEYDMAFVSSYSTELLTVSLGSYFNIFIRPVLRVYYCQCFLLSRSKPSYTLSCAMWCSIIMLQLAL